MNAAYSQVINYLLASIVKTQLYRLTEHFLRKANFSILWRTADAVLAVADAVNIEKEIADRSNSKVVYVNLMSQELLHRSDNTKTSLLSDSPPNSPYHQMEETNDDNELSRSRTGGEEREPDNVFEMDSRLEELDIYGDFEYDLEDEDFIGASALKRFDLQGDCVHQDPLSDKGVPEKTEYSGSRQTLKANLGSESYSENLIVPGVSLQASSGEMHQPVLKQVKMCKQRKSNQILTRTSNRIAPVLYLKRLKLTLKSTSDVCKSGAIALEQYMWAVGKTTEYVKKYHSKEKNSNFLIEKGRR
ncbi:hypothetical protein Acr_09g0007670 [Actinidia rufa]|uniref:Uncharacterized protein n=1 Tax=Actinidia rufa TaxID=165716 RepID=A0A7J0F6Q2_9ERIC|nr:hypothetical protein Acr_09g0007670 [Actinidia rufa]